MPGTRCICGSDCTSAVQIAEAEQALGVDFPAAFRESLQVHDGEGEDEAWLFGSYSLLSLEFIVKLWQQEKDAIAEMDADGWEAEYIAPEIKEVPWNRKWVPFAYDGSGGYLCIDLDPTDQGGCGAGDSDHGRRGVRPSGEGFCPVYDDLLRIFKLPQIKSRNGNRSFFPHLACVRAWKEVAESLSQKL